MLISRSPCARVLRLDPADENDYQEFLNRVVPRLAELQVKRGLWNEDGALESSKAVYAGLLPQGLATPKLWLRTLVDDGSNARVGEVLYKVEELGGKVDFLIEWIWVDPQHRRRGYATQALLQLENEARRVGADRTRLFVWMDNPEAAALYSSLGYTTISMGLSKTLSREP